MRRTALFAAGLPACAFSPAPAGAATLLATAFAVDAGGGVELLDQRPVTRESRDASIVCGPQYSDVATDCVLLRVPRGELDYGPPPKGLRH